MPWREDRSPTANTHTVASRTSLAENERGQYASMTTEPSGDITHIARNSRIAEPPPEATLSRFAEPLTLACNASLNGIEIAYETFGTLNGTRSNAVLICHALTGDSHVTQGDSDRPGWWDAVVGPGLGIDTNACFVICSNVLGGCSGTTGPASTDPATGKPYGPRFPIITVEDMVRAQALLLDQLGIARLAAVVGGSVGGMQALAWAKLYPERVHAVIADATSPSASAQAIAFNEVGRRAILEDPDYQDGDYYGAPNQPDAGLAIARMIGHITYLSDESMWKKFGRRLRDRDAFAFDFIREFEVETYLAYQGKRFIERFDANSYLYMTKAMDYFDLSYGFDSLGSAVANFPNHFLVLSFSSDWLFPTYRSEELITALLANHKQVTSAEIISPYGHDAFLLEAEQQNSLIGPFLRNALTHNAQEVTQ